jgi:hypothetical protein
MVLLLLLQLLLLLRDAGSLHTGCWLLRCVASW